MAVSTPTYADIRRQINTRKLAPIYVLHGEESYFIDELAKAFEALVPEDERDFNYYALYAPEIDPELVGVTCRRYPIMADMQVVLLKEAQAVNANIIDKLSVYAEAPTSTTVLVVCFRGAQAKGKDFLAAVKGNGGVIFESKKLTDRNIGSVVSDIVKEKGLNIEPKGLSMLCDYLGADAAKIYNEIDKLAFILGPGAMITPESIERNVGISKDYNNFELVDALAAKNTRKVFEIVDYFRSNPKKNPAILTVSAVFSYFSGLLVAQFTRDKSPSSLKTALGLKWDSQLSRYNQGMRNYNAYKTIEIISALRDFDAKSKGIGSRQSEFNLLHDLMFHILTAPGKIVI